MRKLLIISPLFFLLFFTSCKKESDSIEPNPDFIPPVDEIKFTNNSSFFFGFGNSGSFKFSTAISNDLFKVIINKTDYFGPTPYGTDYTFKYGNDYLLKELEILQQAQLKTTTLKFTYSGQRLTSFTEWEGNTKHNTFDITNEDLPGGSRKLSIAPYVAVNGAGIDTLSHSLILDNLGKVTEVSERARSTGPFAGISTKKISVYYSNDNVISIRGYELYTDLISPRKDSIWDNFSIIRFSNNENPVLDDYLSLIYGSDFYNILTYCQRFRFDFGTVSSGSDLLILPDFRKASNDEYQYLASVYTNGVFSHSQSGNYTKENILDSKNRLIWCKVNGSTPSNYYTWEILYK